MTKNASFKRAVRAHIARTGLTYCQARQELMAQRQQPEASMDNAMKETQK